jgi:thiamine pyrophosphate-dependent acetolactate synthase large subunit-like protein
MDYEVQICYDSFRASESVELVKMAAGDTTTGGGSTVSGQTANLPENEGRGFDFVKFAEACGAMGERVTEPGEIKAALKRGVESGAPYIIDIILERDTDCSMGVSIDAINEFE